MLRELLPKLHLKKKIMGNKKITQKVQHSKICEVFVFAENMLPKKLKILYFCVFRNVFQVRAPKLEPRLDVLP